MSTAASHDDANLIVKLYELRREDRLRAARAWFAQSFKCTSMEEMLKLCPPDAPENAYLRQLITYWEMVASFLNAGVLNKELFYKSGMELLFTFERIRPVLAEFRKARGNPLLYGELEKASEELISWMNAQSSEAYPAFLRMVRGA